MSAESMEILEIFESLPVEKKREVTDFARFLFERSEEDIWEELINGEHSRDKLEAYARVCEEEDSEKLDLNRL